MKQYPQTSADIVERLRNFAVWNNRQSHYEPVPLCKEAADEIERLRDVIEAIDSECLIPGHLKDLIDAALKDRA